jgi:hypothetical protein
VIFTDGIPPADILSSEIARDLWVRLHEKSVGSPAFGDPLTPPERTLYDRLCTLLAYRADAALMVQLDLKDKPND